MDVRSRTVRQGVRMNRPAPRFALQRRFVPTVQDKDIGLTVAVDVFMPQTMIVLEGAIFMRIFGLAERMKQPICCGLTVARSRQNLS